ncbi:ABC transporter substrate-binding protein [Spirillospora sp. CA-294931]|uniref:ABC transporter substrate-binding protein n=1 Tax=Spirillospora sp. CA-294931 TaxID=3240042 RepID=UPI003D90D3CB
MNKRIGAAAVAATLVLGGCGVFRGDEDAKAPGVTEDACPNAVNKKNGCIYLGIISDLTVGPFKALAVPITDAQKAFWKRVNQQGGIGGYDIDVTKYIRDNKYNPETHNQVYQEIKGKVLALAQTLGSPTTAAIIRDMKSSKVVATPASWTSAWNFEDVILESGANYCVESMNAVDYAVQTSAPKSVMAVHYAGDYGADAAAGAKAAATAQKLKFSAVETPQGQDNQGRAVDAIVKGKPDLVVLTTGPVDAGTVIGQAAARGFKGRYIGTSPSWNKGLLKSPAAPAIKAQYLQSAPWSPFQSETAGHKAMREAIGKVDPNDGYTAGWVWSYPLKAALQKAAANKDLTRDGLLTAVKQIDRVDYEGTLPSGAGNFKGDSNAGAVRTTLIAKPDETQPTGVKVVKEAFTGPTAMGYKLDAPCFGKL